jgi:hypothetical protein
MTISPVVERLPGNDAPGAEIWQTGRMNAPGFKNRFNHAEPHEHRRG